MSVLSQPAPSETGPRPGALPTPEQVRESLRAVEDPEIGVNIVDLGLVYSVWMAEADVLIHLTMTSPACPLHEPIQRELRETLRQDWPGLGAIRIELVWQPPWTPDMLSPMARRVLSWLT